MAVVALQHPEIAMAELVGNEFDRYASIGHQAGGRVPKQVGCPVALEVRGDNEFSELVPNGLRLAWPSMW